MLSQEVLPKQLRGGKKVLIINVLIIGYFNESIFNYLLHPETSISLQMAQCFEKDIFENARYVYW
jgi:hypothetical protein